MGKSMQQWARAVIESPGRVAIPIMTHPGIELAGNSVRQAVTDGEIHARAIVLLNKRFPAAASTVIMDLTVEAEAFGAKVNFPEEEVPSVTERLVTDSDSVVALAVPDLTVARVPQYLKANRLTAQSITDKPVFAGCIGPFSLAGRLFDLSEMMMEMYIAPETIHLLLSKCTDFLVTYCRAIKATGVNGIIIAEPAAGLVSNDDCRAFSSVYIRQMVEAVQDENFMVVLHNCGNGGHCTSAMVETGAAGLHFGNKIDMVQALTDVPPHLLVMGNLDPVGLFKQSTPQEVEKATGELLERVSAYPNFVLSSGCDVPPHIPFDNIEAFYRGLENYNRL